uniref:Uncharacterized protein n=1 Tax=Arundo donax TaxID=35708 RepID=A0A0A9BE71_ARUDO
MFVQFRESFSHNLLKNELVNLRFNHFFGVVTIEVIINNSY